MKQFVTSEKATGLFSLFPRLLVGIIVLPIVLILKLAMVATSGLPSVCKPGEKSKTINFLEGIMSGLTGYVFNRRLN